MEQNEALNDIALEGAPPEWVELLPQGPVVVGRDGRHWSFGLQEQQAVMEAFKAQDMPLVIDWEHASEKKAPQGEEAPAAGWITELEIRIGALWGKVEWTKRAAEQIVRKEYRYLSPVFLHTKDNQIVRVVSAGLVNQPNLKLVALNYMQLSSPHPATQSSYQARQINPEEQAICQALGVEPNDYLKTLETDHALEEALRQMSEDDMKIAQSFGLSPTEYMKSRTGAGNL